MQFERDFARRFRESADLMRSLAAGETDLCESGLLDRIAEEYLRTADELEALDRANPDPGSANEAVKPAGEAIAA